MNIIILSNTDIASNYALNLLLPELAGHSVRVYLSSQVGTSNTNKPAKALTQLKFFEQSLFTDILFPLIDAQKSPADTRLKTFNQLSCYLQQPITTVRQINSEQIINQFQQYNLELIISIRFGLILHEQIIASSRFGVINLHSGKLPQYQGVMPTFRAMLNGDSELATTLHFISDRTIDSGSIIDSTSIKIQPPHSYLWHLLKLYEDGIKTIVQAVKLLQEGKQLRAISQQDKAEYFSFPNENEIVRFATKGFRFYDVDEISKFSAQYMQNN